MRAPNDGRGEDRWPEEHGSSSADHEATQAFTRRGTGPVPNSRPGPDRDGQPLPGPEDPTQEFTRDTSTPDERVTQAFTRNPLPAAAPAAPQSETPQPPAPGTDTPAEAGEPGEGGTDTEGKRRRGFTRRFVRARVGGRGQQSPRDEAASEPGESAADPAAQAPQNRPEDGWDRPRSDDPPADHRPYGPTPEPEEHGPRVSDPADPRRERREPPPRGPRRHKKRRFRLRWLITLVLVIALAIPPATWGWVWYTARQDDRDRSDAIIVLGASQYNGVPSPVFEARLRQAQSLYQQGVAPMIITVGGKQPADNHTEAAAGRDWLTEVGVPPEQVIALEEGADTLQSIGAVAEVYDQKTWETAIIVSDPWHSLRAKQMAADHGIEAGTSPARSGPAVIERSTQLWYITRETASLWYYWIFKDSSDIQVNAA
ncbi:hypothetical protein GCM10007147_01200 [Nocardiopsis kunsanensis]|uniref:DUF218 domain-containing protein n=1 Tax=Nocardiopsis kunsanensis TaxID=141693 RepID=A0A918X626_9ACTN|nr:YdcF family protein [Nocardiopsis kunsanensis]GHD14784.1 hypothetical protein GCM10007147_01200 [Nocardiopsis kunsanensis]